MFNNAEIDSEFKEEEIKFMTLLHNLISKHDQRALEEFTAMLTDKDLVMHVSNGDDVEVPKDWERVEINQGGINGVEYRHPDFFNIVNSRLEELSK